MLRLVDDNTQLSSEAGTLVSNPGSLNGDILPSSQSRHNALQRQGLLVERSETPSDRHNDTKDAIPAGTPPSIALDPPPTLRQHRPVDNEQIAKALSALFPSQQATSTFMRETPGPFYVLCNLFPVRAILEHSDHQLSDLAAVPPVSASHPAIMARSSCSFVFACRKLCRHSIPSISSSKRQFRKL